MTHSSFSHVTISECWFHTLNLPSGSQMLKSSRMMPTALGYDGQCGVLRRNLSRKRLTLGKLQFEMNVDNIRCTYGSNKTQHRDRINLRVTQSLNQAFGRSIDFHHALDEFPGCRPTMKVSIWADHGSNIFGVSNNLHLTELFAILRDPRAMLSTERNAGASVIIKPERE